MTLQYIDSETTFQILYVKYYNIYYYIAYLNFPVI